MAPNGFFAEDEYRAANPDVVAAISAGQLTSGLHHFAMRHPPAPGTLTDYDPQPAGHGGTFLAEQTLVLSDNAEIGSALWWYDKSFYLTVYPDVHALKRPGAFAPGWNISWSCVTARDGCRIRRWSRWRSVALSEVTIASSFSFSQ